MLGRRPIKRTNRTRSKKSALETTGVSLEEENDADETGMIDDEADVESRELPARRPGDRRPMRRLSPVGK
jgi:hypothetical protein